MIAVNFRLCHTTFQLPDILTTHAIKCDCFKHRELGLRVDHLIFDGGVAGFLGCWIFFFIPPALQDFF